MEIGDPVISFEANNLKMHNFFLCNSHLHEPLKFLCTYLNIHLGEGILKLFGKFSGDKNVEDIIMFELHLGN